VNGGADRLRDEGRREEGGPSADPDPLVALARRTVERLVRTGQQEAAALRGCLGTIGPTRDSLAEEIVANAASAASRDPRFPPVGPDELEGLHISVDVLGDPEEVASVGELDPQQYGLIVRTDDGRQALLLPDLEGVETAEQQLAITCRKGGVDPVRDRFRLYRFTVTRHA
jgi:AmmeMemoRadiSam system protein A